jgi:hypothetical protein
VALLATALVAAVALLHVYFLYVQALPALAAIVLLRLSVSR